MFQKGLETSLSPLITLAIIVFSMLMITALSELQIFVEIRPRSFCTDGITSLQLAKPLAVLFSMLVVYATPFSLCF